MPKPTFFNLPESKRRAFLDAATEEFATHDFHTASISHLVATLGIAKGSVYQYFEDKRDLYLYLIEQAMQDRIAYVQRGSAPNTPGGFMAYTAELLELGVRFTLEHPRLSQLLSHALSSASPLRDEVLQRINERSLGFIRGVLAQGVAAGEINPDLDLDLVAYLLNLITTDLGGYLAEQLGIDPQSLLEGDSEALAGRLDDLSRVFASANHFLWRGLANPASRVEA